MTNDLPTVSPETLTMIARLKSEYGVTTTGVSVITGAANTTASA